MTSLANENIGCHVISGVASFFSKVKNRQKARPEKNDSKVKLKKPHS